MKILLLIISLLSLYIPLTGGMKVAATIFPLYDMVREIGGERVEVELIVSPGASPHLFEFTPGKLRSLQKSRVIFCIGHGVDDWLTGVKNALQGASISIVDKGISLIPSGRSLRGRITYNPHYWLSIPEAIVISENIKEILQREDPKNAVYYEKNFREFSQKLKKAEKRYTKMLSRCKKRKIVTFHDAWVYFARFLNLEILGTFEPSGAGEPSPRHLRELARKIKKYHVRVIFIEPQLSSSVLDTFAKEQRLKLKVLDPLGGIEGRKNYLELMDYNVKTVKEALEE